MRRRVLMDPASIAFAALAEEYRREGRLDDAIETSTAGLKRHPFYVSARVTLGRALLAASRLDEAQAEFERVLQSAPENLAATRGLAQIREQLEGPPAAAPEEPQIRALESFLDAVRAARDPSGEPS